MLLIILTTIVSASMHMQPNHGAMPSPYAPQAQPAHAQPPQMQGTNTVPFAKPPPLNQNMPPHAMPPHGGHPGMAAGQDCEQILDPNFCTGPAMDGPGFICSWQGNECDAINPSSPKGQCKMLSNDQAACTMNPDCHWDAKEFECEYGGQPLSHEQQYPPAAPAPAAPAAPGYPAPAAPAAPAPAAAVPVAPGYPAPAAPHAAVPVAPAHPVAPAFPAHPAAPMPGAPAAHPAAPMPGAPIPGHPAAPGAHPGAPPAHHGPPAGPPPAPGHGMPPAGGQALPLMPQDCRRLMEPQCFGPSMKRGEVCMYDAEDFECRSRLATDVEAICKQFDRDPIKCDANKDCFYDQLDFECSEMKFPGQGGKGAAGRNAAWNMPNLGPAMSYVSGTCSNYKDLHSCAGAAQCFWDATANLCINALQAANVCHVLNTAQYCSTNLLCRWQGTVCSPAAGHLRKAHEPMTSQNTSDWNRNLIFAGAASVLGLLMGLALSWAQSKYTKDNTSNEDYRDIMMDINSRQVV